MRDGMKLRMTARTLTSLPDFGSFPGLLRRYRTARRLSQLDLALTCEISARHLSFLETGRAAPSREMVVQLSEGLLLPLGARNALLQAAGFATVYPASPLASEALGPFRRILTEMMERHEDHMVFAREVLEAKAKADERFARRFAAIVEKHDKNLYGAK